MRSRLRIVGAGIKGIRQLTLEGIEALRSAASILHLAVDSEAFEGELRALGIGGSVALNDLYHDGALDEENYDRIVNRVLREVRCAEDVTLLLYGHPRLGVSLTRRLEEEAARHDVAVEVIAAPSSFDTMINDLCRDPLERGSILLDANRLLLLEFQLEPSFDLYIYHVSSIGCPRTNFLDPAGSNRIDLLQAYLLKFYPPEHEAILVSSSAHAGAAGSLERTSIGRLAGLGPSLQYGASLFIPGARPKRVNREFLSLLKASARCGDAPE